MTKHKSQLVNKGAKEPAKIMVLAALTFQQPSKSTDLGDKEESNTVRVRKTQAPAGASSHGSISKAIQCHAAYKTYFT